MAFECQQCGECCTYLGRIHTIVEEYGDNEFLIRNEYTGEKNRVRLDPDKLLLYADKSIFEEWPEACPFLRPDPENHRVCCTIHLTRPEMCRDFGCWRILVLDSEGRRAGRVMGTRMLVADDPDLEKIWELEKKNIDEPDDDRWDEAVTSVLEGYGYVVRK